MGHIWEGNSQIALAFTRFNFGACQAWVVFWVALSFLVYSFGSTWILIQILSFLLITIGEIIIFPFTNSWAMAFSTAHIIAPPLGMKIAESYGFNIMWLIISLFAAITSIGFSMMNRTNL